jgi:hypothetical protein
LPGGGTGIGPALQKARLARGKTLEEASRDTRIRAEYLQALERESFGSLRGDVFVRGFLRSYSSYLGLNPDKVVGVYIRATGRGTEAPASPRPPGSHTPALKVLHRTANWKLAVAVAVTVLAASGAVGLLSRAGPAPESAALPTPDSAALTDEGVTVSMDALKPVHAVVYVDGDKIFSGLLQKGASRFFAGTNLVRIELASGGRVDFTVNGVEVPTPGDEASPFSASYLPQDYQESPSPSA